MIGRASVDISDALAYIWEGVDRLSDFFGVNSVKLNVELSHVSAREIP